MDADRRRIGCTRLSIARILASEGREEEAVPYLQRAQAQYDRWADLLRRLPASGLLPADDALIDRLTAAMLGE